MNGKFILLLTLSLNIVGILITSGYAQVNPSSDLDFGNQYLTSIFFDDIDDLNATTSLSFNNQTEAAISSLDEGQEENTVLDGISAFILQGWDVVKMIAGVLSLITPYPIIAFIASLGLPGWFTLVLGSMIVVPYILSLAEFVRGSSF